MIKGWCDFKSLSFYPDKFGNNKYYDKWDLTFLICSMTFHNHLLK